MIRAKHARASARRWAALNCLPLLAVAACAASAAPIFQPAALPKQATAIIRGSQDPEPGALRPDSHVFLVAVDGQVTGFDWSYWNDQVPVAPGRHLIEFGPCVCNLVLRAI